MTFNETKYPGDLIQSSDYNDLVDLAEWASSNASMATGDVTVDSISSQSISGGAIRGNLYKPFDFTIFNNNNTYYLIDDKNNVIDSNSTNINPLIDTSILALQKTHGGIIHLKSGKYYFSGDTYLSCDNIIFEGEGDSTRIRGEQDNKNGNILFVSGSNSIVRDFFVSGGLMIWNTTRKSGSSRGRLSNILFENIHISAQKVSGSNASRNNYGVFNLAFISGSDITDITVRNCYVISANSFAFSAFPVWYSQAGLNTIKRVTFRDCIARKIGLSEYATNNWSIGFSINENQLRAQDILFDHCIAEDTWESGFHIESAPAPVNVTYQNCIARRNGILKKAWYLAGINQNPSHSGTSNTGASYGSNYFDSFSGCSYINCVGEEPCNYFANGTGGYFSNCYFVGSGSTTDCQGGIVIYASDTDRRHGRLIIENCTLQRGVQGNAISVSNVSGVIIKNNKIFNVCSSGSASNLRSLIYIGSGCPNAIVEGNYLSPMKVGSTIYADFDVLCAGATSPDTIIKDNYFDLAKTNSVRVTSSKMQIINNIFNSTQTLYAPAIQLSTTSEDSLIAGNTFRGLGGDGVIVYAKNCIVTDNHFIKSRSTAGIYDRGAFSVITNNIFSGCKASIYTSEAAFNSLIANNMIVNGLSTGIYTYATGSSILNNYCFNIVGNPGIQVGGRSNLIQGNTCDHCTSRGILIDGLANKVINNNCYDDFASKIQSYGIDENSTSQGYHVIRGNFVSGNSVAGIRNINLSTNYVKDNVGHASSMQFIGKPDAKLFQGELIKVSGGTSELTYILISVKNSSGDWEWVQLGTSS